MFALTSALVLGFPDRITLISNECRPAQFEPDQQLRPPFGGVDFALCPLLSSFLRKQLSWLLGYCNSLRCLGEAREHVATRNSTRPDQLRSEFGSAYLRSDQYTNGYLYKLSE